MLQSISIYISLQSIIKFRIKIIIFVVTCATDKRKHNTKYNIENKN